MDVNKSRIAIIGLGYIGLPLAVEFGKKLATTGFDTNKKRVAELTAGKDTTLETSADELKQASRLSFTANIDDIGNSNVFIVTVPTPVDRYKKPDLRCLHNASATLGKVLKKNDVAIFESTVYPGATEEICVPILERESGLQFNRDFFVGYSPERINPGDKTHRLTTIKKITSGSDEKTAAFVDELYGLIITAGTHKTGSIKVAEAAKVIENTQRDINIALVNELALIFNRLGIDTDEVLQAAVTKWNFLKFTPGLVGGHCIGVDPYYLTYKAMDVGYNPEIILAGRRLNDFMGEYIADEFIKLLAKNRFHIVDAEVLIMGLAFKENCPDLRNTKVVDIIRKLADYNCKVDVYDPWVDVEKAYTEYGIKVIDKPMAGNYDGIILAVAHDDFAAMGIDRVRRFGKSKHIVYDVKHVFPKGMTDGRL